ncbi:hypothetical protein L208DRAFT_1397346 [Tricholoma matsutake]|nr:hypothetical protein L208DRAFT_1397346 [Tricholoma matsutake 945]
MRLVHRSAVKQFLQPDIQRMVNNYPDFRRSHKDIEAPIIQMVKDQTAYAIFSHWWLDKGELTFQDLLKLESISAAGFNQLMQSPKELMLWDSTALLDQAQVLSANTDAKQDRHDIFEQMEKICNSMSSWNHAAGFVKLVKFCKAARQYQCKYVWLDTGCINKQSSTDLEESIQSMFAWYQNSQICIVHLAGTIKLQDMKLDAQ